MSEWDTYNPWRERVVYVPLEELAEILADGRPARLSDGSTVELTAEVLLENWRQYGFELDGYLLPGQPLGFAAGVRFGSRGSDYLSLYVPDQSKAEDLHARYVQVPSLRH